MSSTSRARSSSMVASPRSVAGVRTGTPYPTAARATGVGRSSPCRPDGRGGAVTTATGVVSLGSMTRSRRGSANEPLPRKTVRGLVTRPPSGQGGHLHALPGDLFLEAGDRDELVERLEVIDVELAGKMVELVLHGPG